ncbi:MAG: DNA polymerase II large subunit [Candidatus ainarchaeum sp.]|nr:DNA polymerase II large subunit [Candidatus ainarchaeum sp.]
MDKNDSLEIKETINSSQSKEEKIEEKIMDANLDINLKKDELLIEFTEKLPPEILVPCSKPIKKYFDQIQADVYKQYNLAMKIKAKGLDTSTTVEMTPAVDLADRAETLINLPGLAKRYREVFEEIKDRRKTYFQLFKEIMEQKWCTIPDDQKRLEIGIKACLLIETEGVVVAPLDGLPKIEINKNPDGTKYVDIYFAGPIRAAGGSSTVIPLILGDYGRIILGLDKYKPTNDEIERYVEEISIYQTEIISRQYKIPDDEIRLIVKNCPVCVNGVPTEEVEVSVHRDLPRIPTNRIRGGVGLVISEGLALKAAWVMEKAKQYANLDWSFLEKFIKVEKKSDVIEIKPNKKMLDGLAAGRPVLAYPSHYGGFRLRYGRGRNTGIMAKAINPACMIVFDEFIAVGTHGKMERPGKATQFFPCSTIDGPIVLLKDGSVVKVNTVEKAEEIKAWIEKIIFIGDILSTFGDFRKSAHPLIPPGYVEEWWKLELEDIIKKDNSLIEKLAKFDLQKYFKNPFEINEDQALLISKEFNVPLHPKYIHYYTALNIKELKQLHEYLLTAKLQNEQKEKLEINITNLNLDNIKLIVEKLPEKKLLEKIGLPHTVEQNLIVIQDYVKTLIATFNLLNLNESKKFLLENKDEKILDYLSNLSNLKIKDKAGSFVGSRMGRPEQAKPREMKGNPHVLFPIGLYGGNTRSINKAIDENNNASGKVNVEIAKYLIPKTNKNSFLAYDLLSQERTVLLNNCKKCSASFLGEMCPKCGGPVSNSMLQEVNLRDELARAKANLKLPLPDLIKGVKGMINDFKEVEPLEKGILRARHDVHIFRDATSRFELLNATITHFKPKEINLTIEKVKELGYQTDYLGNEIISEEQIIEIFPQDIIINDTAGDWMLNVSKFIDDELVLFYKDKPFYNAKTKEDLIGHYVLGLAPHTSAAVTARVLGYTKSRLGYGHPYFVCAKRRNVDGDQDSIMLLMDGLLNFSQKFLANRNGGKMDAAIVFSTIVNPSEIDDEVHQMETVGEYNLNFYEKASQIVLPNSITDIEIVDKKRNKDNQYSNILFTHHTNIFDEGPKKSRYIQLKSMEEKITRQNNLQKKILAVESKDCLEKVMTSHFLPDIIGNSRAFSRQSFRCTTCNEKYRRLPLSGRCYKCGKETIILTIHQGSVKKYLKIAQNLAKQEGLSSYLIQRLDMIEKEIDSVFKDDHEEQKSLFDYA